MKALSSAADKVNDQRQDDTDYKHGNQGKIKSEIAPLNKNITGETAEANPAK